MKKMKSHFISNYSCGIFVLLFVYLLVFRFLVETINSLIVSAVRDRSHDRSQHERTLYHGTTSGSVCRNVGLCVNNKEGSVLFNDTLNTFYLRLYGVKHMVKDQSDSERGNPLPPHGLLFPISSKGSFICIIPHI